MLVRSIGDFNAHDGSYSLQMTFREEWNDPRLVYSGRAPDEFISITNPGLIWTPDLFFSNAMKGFKHKILTDNDMIRIFPNGNCLYSTHVSLQLRCTMDLTSFPVDVQTCDIKIASYAYTEDDLQLRWKIETPIQLIPKLEVPGFVVSKYETGTMPSWTTTGSYGSLIASFTFRRDVNSYWITIYVLLILLVILSYLPFWLDDKGLRYLISVIVFMTTLLGVVLLNESIPQTSYAKAIDIWNGICLSFTSASIFLLFIIDQCCQADVEEEKLEDFESAMSEWIFVPKPRDETFCLTVSSCQRMVRIVFPASFAIISVSYFLVYFMR